MRFIMHPGGSHDQEQDSEYDTRISYTREVRSRHCDHLGDRQEYRAQVSAPSRAFGDASSTTQARSVEASRSRSGSARIIATTARPCCPACWTWATRAA